jgi:hypothetical protein
LVFKTAERPAAARLTGGFAAQPAATMLFLQMAAKAIK